MQKRGVSHIEVVLSIVLFVTALLTLFYFFSPVDQSKVANSALSYTLDSLIENASTTLVTYSIKVNAIAGKEMTVTVDNAETQGLGVHAENLQGDNLYAKKSGENVCVNRNTENFIILKFAEGLEENDIADCPPANSSFYQIGLVETQVILSERNLLFLNKSYYEEYSATRDMVSIPSNINFGFDLIFSNGEEIKGDRFVPSGNQVYARSARVKVLNLNGTITNADLVVKVW